MESIGWPPVGRNAATLVADPVDYPDLFSQHENDRSRAAAAWIRVGVRSVRVARTARSGQAA
jgi:hypothetical protein